MPSVVFRVFFGEAPATRSHLDRIETITVEQEMDMAWEARLKFPICLDAQGQWRDEETDLLASFTRIRVEVKVGKAGFVPLIDGPIVGRDTEKSSEPGRSSITVVVQDDSVYLNREARVECFEDRRDHQVAEELFRTASQIDTLQVEEAPNPSRTLPPVVVQRGTAMQLLRQLAQRQEMHAYVLPGEQQGQSVGLFVRLPTEPSDLPPLVLLGKERNVEQISASSNDQQPANTQAQTLNISDKGIVTSTSSVRNLEVLGSDLRLPRNADVAQRLARPTDGDTVDVERSAQGQTERASYSFRITGSTIPECYHGVLRPYLVVSTRGINKRDSGSYIIQKVTHTLSRSTYTQAFTLIRNAQSQSPSEAVNNLTGVIS